MKYPVVLQDRVGREYPRKNRYLAELALAQQEGDSAKEQALLQGKGTHPYIQKLRAYESSEKKFLEQLKAEEPAAEKQIDDTDKKLRTYMMELFRAEKQVEFYKDYVDLSYDAEMAYRIAQKKVDYLPAIIVDYRLLLLDLAYARQEKTNPQEEAAYQKELADYKESRKKVYDARMAQLRESYKSGNISRTAFENERRITRKEYQEDLDLKAYRSPVRYQRDLIRNLKHHLKNDNKQQEAVLEEEISAVRRSTPSENEKLSLWRCYLSIPFPGLGQILNGQVKKGLLCLLGALFIYLIAIPYALGYGNYQGDGIAGLITLAQDGRRVDRSLIFMIEGLISILFLFLSVVIIVLAYRDARQVEKDERIGIRPNLWFETKREISEHGFPYFVNIPAILLILFITLVPIFTAVLLSFTGMDPDHQSKFGWVGLQNYATIVKAQGLQGSLFWRILVWTVIWTLGATTLAIAIGMGLAILVNGEHIRGKRFFRTVYILPWAVPAFITIMFFSVMLAPNGFLSDLISNLAGTTVNVKNDTTLTRTALILIQGWCGNAYVFLLATGVLQSIPNDLYEAAEMDGANGRQKLLNITLPMLLFQTAPILVGQYTFNFNNYTIIDLFNQGGPFNPSRYGNLAGSSDLLISYIFKLTMDNQYQAFGAAISVLISLALIVIAFMGYRRTAAFKED
ncbi:carbohydrate ABC transporter permease [Kallipyga gabonensis]|uniref:carbohydrate ABC transporter permease n=1 Tax=Kallipyga gabonensis TaxID=1686287 RepID=UPI0006B5A534|nr:sugar ABC transporter permease [Kallipyga gabonensis]